MTLILGSQSPRRKEILGFFSLPFEQHVSFFDEEAVPFTGDPISYVHTLSKGKAEALVSQFPDNQILTADTVVYYKGKIYSKPKNEQEAYQHLKDLVGEWHTVYTSLTLLYQQQLFQAIEATQVLFNSLSDDEIHTYYRKLPYADKAGGYGIQGSGSLIVKEISGCYYNVMGLPINALRQLLLHAGINLWDFIA